MKPIIDEREELAKYKVARHKKGEISNIKTRVQPPRLGMFIDKMKKDSIMGDYQRREK